MTPADRERCFKKVRSNLDEVSASMRTNEDPRIEDALETLLHAVCGLYALALDKEKGTKT